MSSESIFRPLRHRTGPAVLTLAYLLVLASVAGAAGPAGLAEAHEHTPNFDARVAYNDGFEARIGAAQRGAVARIDSSEVDLAVTYDLATGATRSLYNRVGYLTGPASGEALTLGLNFVKDHLDVLGLEPEDLEGFEITNQVYSKVSGATHIYLRQVEVGLPVYNAQLHINVNRDGRILSVNNAFLPGIARATAAAEPTLSGVDAALRLAAHLEFETTGAPELVGVERAPGRSTTMRFPELSKRDIVAQLMWLPIRSGDARLVWNFQAQVPGDRHWFDVNVDAHSGEVWTRFDWVTMDSYRAFEYPVESPIHSPMPPPADGRALVVDPQDVTTSPLGWHDTGSTSYTIPRGNNVHAFDDLDANNGPPAVEPDCGAGLDCDFHFPIDFGTADPEDYTDASVANLFYWTNLVHDVQYRYGFDEQAGNFQVNNFGNGGAGNDDVIAMAQKNGPPCPNNAFFSTPPDGNRPTQFMCLWTLSTPRRDFSWDTGVVVHEYGHGISNRLVGGPLNVSCLTNQQQPGEGLSDWWSLAYTAEVGDQGTDVRGAGTYILGQPPDGPGVRPQPYSTDPAVNDYTYESIIGLSIPHGVGSVWAQVAWEMYWALVDHHGFDIDLYNAMGGSGNQRAMLYINEGMKNTACSPSFLDVRDGVIQAVTDNYGGEDVCRVWATFANFGLGTNAAGNPNNAGSAVNGFLLPEVCKTEGLIFRDGFESGDTTRW